MPAIYIISNIADTYWDSLIRYISNYEEQKVTSTEDRNKIIRKNLKENPYNAIYYLERCFKLFKEYILILKFKIEDWQYYIEF